jgi:tripartite-type tricarboxylate transporter receptor subunit TctC
MKRRGVGLGVLLLAASLAAHAESYPARPVKIVVPWLAGGVADISARALAEAMREALGQPAIVENRPGASGKIGTALVAHAAPDGYTLLLGSPSAMTLPTVIDPQPGFDPVKDFVPIAQLSSSTYFLVVGPTPGLDSMAGLIAYARAHPGALNYGSWGNGTATHIAGAMLASAAGIDIVHVPYKGDGPVMQELIAGRLQFAFVIDAKPNVEAGRLRALGTTSPEPWFTLPDVPPIGQSSLPGFKFMAWQGLLAPAGTPDEITAMLNRTVNQALQSERMRAILTQSGFKPVGGAPAQLARTIDEDLATIRRVVAEAHLRFEN